jgi:hypothetical protein
MATVYFVSYFLHNKDNDGWAYKVVDKYTDLGLAKKAYHTELSKYIGGATYDSVAVTLTDSYGNKIMSEYWQMEVEPESEE